MKRNFGGFGGGVNIQQMMRQAQKMQAEMAKAQEELAEKEYEATAGGGMVSCKVSGGGELTALSIKPEAVDPDDVEMLEDLVLAAVNEALRAMESDKNQRLSAIAPMGGGGLF